MNLMEKQLHTTETLSGNLNVNILFVGWIVSAPVSTREEIRLSPHVCVIDAVIITTMFSIILLHA